MNRQEVAWIMVRVSGLWLLVLALQILPTVALSLPELGAMLVHWDLLTSMPLKELLSRGPTAHVFSIMVRALFYLLAGGWLLCRGDCLITMIAESE